MKRTPRLPRQALLSALTAAALAGACAHASGPVVPARVVPLPLDDARILPLLEQARATATSRHALRATGRVKLDSEQGSGRVRSVILAQRPARLRFEALNLLGQTQTLLVTDGERFAFFDGKSLERGPSSPGVLRRTLGLDLEVAEAVRALLAAPAPTADPPREAFLLGEDRVIEFALQRLRFDAAGELRATTALDAFGGVRWLAEYADWQDTGTGRYPFRMSLRFPSRALRADLRFDDVELNPALAPDLFRLPGGGEP